MVNASPSYFFTPTLAGLDVAGGTKGQAHFQASDFFSKQVNTFI